MSDEVFFSIPKGRSSLILLFNKLSIKETKLWGVSVTYMPKLQWKGGRKDLKG